MTFALIPLMATIGPLALLLLMAIVFAESGLLAGFFLPGDSLLFTAGILVASGVLALPLWLVAAGVVLAAVVGDQVGYLIGRRYGPRVFSRPESRFFSTRYVEHATDFFARHGPKAVILARFVPVVRTFTPVIAGVGAMSRRRFTAYNAVGGLAWGVGVLLAGYFLGGIPFVAAHVDLILISLVAVSLVPAAAALLGSRRRPRTPTPPPEVPTKVGAGV
jgi:membrane protein DedA with SNARE-associated domain